MPEQSFYTRLIIIARSSKFLWNIRMPRDLPHRACPVFPLGFDTNLCAFEGYDVALTLGKENSPVFINMIVDLRRTTPIRVFSIFMAFLMLLVAGGVFVMAIRVVRSPVAPRNRPSWFFCGSVVCLSRNSKQPAACSSDGRS